MRQPPHNSNLGDLLLTLRREIIERIRKDGFTHDLSFSQGEVLRFIGPSGKVTMKSIANYLKITPPSATEIVSEMEKKGLVKRKSGTKDKRITLVSLSPSAKKLFVSLSATKDVILQRMISKLSEADRKSLERIIKILITK